MVCFVLFVCFLLLFFLSRTIFPFVLQFFLSVEHLSGTVCEVLRVVFVCACLCVCICVCVSARVCMFASLLSSLYQLICKLN